MSSPRLRAVEERELTSRTWPAGTQTITFDGKDHFVRGNDGRFARVEIERHRARGFVAGDGKGRIEAGERELHSADIIKR